MNSDFQILLVEDDQNLGFVVKDNLESAGNVVDWCTDGVKALGRFGLNKYDLCIVDVMLPKLDGFTLVRKIREINEQIPVLFLTAKSLEEDRIKGFEIGADDYISKPFSMEELLLRVKVFLKRNSVQYQTPEVAERTQVGKFIFDMQNLSLSNGNVETKLTQKEADLLQLFVKNKEIVLKREHILKSVWGQSDYFLGRSLDVFITRLRKYLKDDPDITITNYHKVGFKFSVHP
jgi:DNA-binding response OmpR family regulator